jgi:hypothetical protein
MAHRVKSRQGGSAEPALRLAPDHGRRIITATANALATLGFGADRSVLSSLPNLLSNLLLTRHRWLGAD